MANSLLPLVRIVRAVCVAGVLAACSAAGSTAGLSDASADLYAGGDGLPDGGIAGDGAVATPDTPSPNAPTSRTSARVFVTSTSYTGRSLGGGPTGTSGADGFCASAAAAASPAVATMPRVGIHTNELGERGETTYRVWTGTKNGGQASPDTCVNWNASLPGSGDRGTVGIAGQKDEWTDFESAPCGTQNHLYCFELQ